MGKETDNIAVFGPAKGHLPLATREMGWGICTFSGQEANNADRILDVDRRELVKERLHVAA